jgi:autotransporter-associated beta strand protein
MKTIFTPTFRAVRCCSAALLVALVGLPSESAGQIQVQKTVHSNLIITDNTTTFTSLVWSDAGLSSILSASITLSLSSPFETNPLKLDDLSASLYFGFPDPDLRQAALPAFTSTQQTFNLGSAFNGPWMAGDTWYLAVTDSRQGGVARLDRWTLSLTGELATSGTIDPGEGGVVSASGEGTQTVQATLQTTGSGDDAVKVQATEGQAIVVSAGLTGSGDIRKEGSGVMRLEGSSTNFTGRVFVDSGAVEIASSGALGASGRLEVAGTNSTVRLANSVVFSNQITLAEGASARLDGAGTIAGAITGSGGIVKEGTNALTLSGTNTFTGSTVIREGRLILDSTASLASSSVTVTNATLTINGVVSGTTTVEDGGVLGGSGTVGTLVMGEGGTLEPGNSAGTVTATNGATWTQNGFYNWEIFDLDGPAGVGWDLLDVTGGTLDLTGITTAGGFTINLITLQADNTTQGALTGFDPTASYSNWLIARAPEVVGFDPTLFTLNSANFVGATGTFGITLMDIEDDKQGVFLTYTGAALGEPIPEPGTWAAAVLLALAAGYVRWRRRRVGV